MFSLSMKCAAIKEFSALFNAVLQFFNVVKLLRLETREVIVPKNEIIVGNHKKIYHKN